MLRDDLKSEFNALLPGRSTEAGATRRTALKAALGVGYAASDACRSWRRQPSRPRPTA